MLKSVNMDGHSPYRCFLKFSSLGLLVALTGCIPQGGGDYRITNTVPVKATPETPQLVPESAILIETPSWSPATVERNSQQVEASRYQVEPGDTLLRIEAITGASLADIAAANNLLPPYILKVGQQLAIPSGLYHTVNMGETGIAIARAYGVSWDEVVALNKLQTTYLLVVDQRLRLPARAAAAVTNPVSVGADDISPEQRAAAFNLKIDDVITGGKPALNAVQANNGAKLPANISQSAFAGSFTWPIAGRTISRFGNKGGGKINDGIDISAALGTPVLASAGGIVVYSGNEIGVFGGLILVDHGSGWVTAYGHIGQLFVARGDTVLAGQKLGTVGDTGYVDQPQLHFEIRRDRKPVDPLTLLPV